MDPAPDPVNAVAEAFRRLGAPEAQARTMAAQLVRRAEQLAQRDGITPAPALERLLQLSLGGARGDAPPDQSLP
jgi:hypothetical protein